MHDFRSIRTWLKKQFWLQQERQALATLNHVGGVRALTAIRGGLSKAEQFKEWDEWSLTRHSIIWLAELILEEKIHRIVELGAGYSTIALAEYLKNMALPARIDSFEHESTFVGRISPGLINNENVTLHCASLLQVEDAVFEHLFSVSEPNKSFLKLSKTVPKEYYKETRLKNTFYDFDFQIWEQSSVDLLILDGPNGNGRSLAFPLLKRFIRFPCWVLIDDYLDYPFLDYLGQIYSFTIQKSLEAKNKEYVLVKIHGLSE